MESTKLAVISGASGFIASHLIRALELRKIKVVPLPRKLLYDSQELYFFLQKNLPNYIFHLAAYGNMAPQKDEDMILMANVFATWNLLKESQFVPYEAFINMSSSSVMLQRQTIYSATKASGEALCRAFSQEYQKPIVTIRPYSVYGPGEADFRFIPTVFRSCLKGEAMQLAPTATHDWVYVEDLVDMMMAVSKEPHKYAGNTYDCGTGVSTTNEAVVKMIEKITGKKANISGFVQLRSFDNPNWSADPKNGLIDKAWKYRIQLEEGLAKTYAYYKERYK